MLRERKVVDLPELYVGVHFQDRIVNLTLGDMPTLKMTSKQALDLAIQLLQMVQYGHPS